MGEWARIVEKSRTNSFNLYRQDVGSVASLQNTRGREGGREGRWVGREGREGGRGEGGREEWNRWRERKYM